MYFQIQKASTFGIGIKNIVQIRTIDFYQMKNKRSHDIVYSFFYTFVGIRQNIHNL